MRIECDWSSCSFTELSTIYIYGEWSVGFSIIVYSYSLFFIILHDCVCALDLDTRMNHPTNRLEIDTKTDRDEFAARQTLWNPDERLIIIWLAEKKKIVKIIRKDKATIWNEIRIGSDSITVAHSRFTWNETDENTIWSNLRGISDSILMRMLCWGSQPSPPQPQQIHRAIVWPSANSMTFYIVSRHLRGEHKEEQLKPAHIS